MAVVRKEDHTNVLFTFGRFQPPTIGHKVLIDFIAETAAIHNADPYVFVSSTQNKSRVAKATFESTKANENPLSVYDKVSYLKKMYHDTKVEFINTTECECTSIFQIIDKLRSAGYIDITMAVGSDRVESFQKILSRVNVTVIPAGAPRTVNANSSNVKAMSGTKMREAAVSGNIEAFKRGVLIGSMTDEDAMNLFNLVRQGLGYSKGGALRNKTYKKRVIVKKHRKSRRYVLRLEERT
jgi:nicotinic acid mononucleotide adenylyltransferase